MVVLGGWLDLMILEDFSNLRFYDFIMLGWWLVLMILEDFSNLRFYDSMILLCWVDGWSWWS